MMIVMIVVHWNFLVDRLVNRDVLDHRNMNLFDMVMVMSVHLVWHVDHNVFTKGKWKVKAIR